MEFPERLRALRREARLSQRDLAERVNVNFTYLSKIEKRTGGAAQRGRSEEHRARIVPRAGIGRNGIGRRIDHLGRQDTIGPGRDAGP